MEFRHAVFATYSSSLDLSINQQVGDKSEDLVAATIGLQYILNLKKNLGIGSPRILNFLKISKF